MPLRALVAAVVVAVVLVGWLALWLRDDRAATVAREQAVAAARLHAPEILSYDHRHLDQDFAKAQEHLTGKFKEDYARTTVTVVKPVAVDNKAVVEARVVAVSTIWARPGEAQVLLFVNQQTVTAKSKGPRVDLNRVRMTLRRTEPMQTRLGHGVRGRAVVVPLRVGGVSGGRRVAPSGRSGRSR